MGDSSRFVGKVAKPTPGWEISEGWGTGTRDGGVRGRGGTSAGYNAIELSPKSNYFLQGN